MATLRVTLKAVNDELSERGFTVRLVKASGYFYFQGGETDEWLDKTVSVSNVSSFSLLQWTANQDFPTIDSTGNIHFRRRGATVGAGSGVYPQPRVATLWTSSGRVFVLFVVGDAE